MKLHTRELGSGDPVLLLHGVFGQARNLATVQAALAGKHRVVAVDLRNHGASPHGFGMDYPTLAADVLETLDALGVSACAVIGHSMGGKVAMRLALDAPQRVTRLLVADIAPVPYVGELAAYAGAMRAIPLAPGLTRATADTALAAAVPEPSVRGFLLQSLLTGAAPGWRIGLEEIAAGLPDIADWPVTDRQYDGRVVFVAGDRSDYIVKAHHATIRILFPAAQFATVPNAGHWLHVDNPAAFLAIVERFMA